MSKELTPLMKQYWEIKSLHVDKILFFRMGDFFELFYDDAILAAPLLGVTLTQRNKKAEEQTPMCGMPHHSVAHPINKLLTLGHKVAICDQIEDPKLAKGIVRRAVTRILTPGMVYDSDQLSATESHYIACVEQTELSFIDTTTGECFYLQDLSLDEKKNTLSMMPVAEVVLGQNDFWETNDFLAGVTVTRFDGLSQEESHKVWPQSARRLYAYVTSLADTKIRHVLRPFVKRSLRTRMNLSVNTMRHLEIFSTYRGDEKGTLYAAINRTQTSAGARLLRHWLRFPLTEAEAILSRQREIQFFREKLFELKKTREVLPRMGDIERRLSKIALPQCHGRDLTALAHAVDIGIEALSYSRSAAGAAGLGAAGLDPARHPFSKYEALKILSVKILNAIVEDAPLSTRLGHIIRAGVSSELDEINFTSQNATQLVADLERKEKELTGIQSLKIRYNGVFGYYIEVTHVHAGKVPTRYQRKQTLANAERFCTEELLQIEKQVLSAQTRRNELEYTLFEELRQIVLGQAADLIQLAQACALIDVQASLAWLSLEENYCRPVLASHQTVKILDSRHPVIEQHQRSATGLSSFVPNDLHLNPGNCFLLTGPNMAGKSTLMRQLALTAILTQIGSYVPATSATLPIYSGIFTRIGASDQLTEGLSTFMVEMSETAEMLKLADEKSLLIMDEIGRGTATFDGMCLAQAILEHTLSDVKAHVLFATHYHELVGLDRKFSDLKNVHMEISERKGVVHFHYALKEGPAGKSYGIHVAKLAGLPAPVIERARSLLQIHENDVRTKNPAVVTSNAVTREKRPAPFMTLSRRPPETQGAVKPLVGSIKPIDVGDPKKPAAEPASTLPQLSLF